MVAETLALKVDTDAERHFQDSTWFFTPTTDACTEHNQEMVGV